MCYRKRVRYENRVGSIVSYGIMAAWSRYLTGYCLEHLFAVSRRMPCNEQDFFFVSLDHPALNKSVPLQLISLY